MADTKKLKTAAKIMFIEHGKSQVEIHQILGVSVQTLTKWVNDPKDNWKQQRTARLNATEKRAEDIKTVIGTLTERRLELFKLIPEAQAKKDKMEVMMLQKETVAMGQEIAMYSKALEAVEKSNKPSLRLYLEIMDAIFKALAEHDKDLYLQTVDFQENHISAVAETLG
jgi:transposase